MATETLTATLPATDSEGNPITLSASVEVHMDNNQVIKFEYVPLSQGGPILRPANPRL